jgi:ribosomal peptide maturation radical SAM protein 1
LIDDRVTDGLRRLIGTPELVLVNPPFAGIDRPSYALHLLQAIASEQGVASRILYGNLLLAASLGELEYERICYASSGALLGERFFAATAYGKKPTFPAGERTGTHIRTSRIDGDLEKLHDIYEQGDLAARWCECLADALVQSGARAVGITTTFEQSAACISLARAVKQRDSSILVLIGGANCEGEMAGGLARICGSADFIFSGESEASFRDWCTRFAAGAIAPPSGEEPVIVGGAPCQDLDSLPLPDYSDFYDQLFLLLPDSKVLASNAVWLPFETSRGCWWGAKHHCTFCGINGEGMGFRQKDADKAVADLARLAERHPTNRVLMLDNIMPHTYFGTLLPKLASREERLHIFYEQKANLDFRRVQYLKNAGVEVIQPGIEALSSDLLRHMRKGVKAHQNIALLRYALMNNVFVNWNLLHSFPDDHLEWYTATRDLLPFLFHLCPPTGVFGLSIDRFSPYFDLAADFGLSEVKPVSSYYDVLPEGAPVDRIAYHFEATYRSGSRENPAVIGEIEALVAQWRRAWESTGEVPRCHVIQIDPEHYLLIDTRPVAAETFAMLTAPQARIGLLGTAEGGDGTLVDWALSRNLCLRYEDAILPLATADPAVYLGIDRRAEKGLRAFDERTLTDPLTRDAVRAL